MSRFLITTLHLLILFFATIHGSYSKNTNYTLQSNSDLIGRSFKIKLLPEDQLTEIAYKYRIAYDKLLAANPVISNESSYAEQLIIPGQHILPNQRSGITINLAQLRLFYFPKNQPKTVYTYPIAIGSPKNPTPELVTYIYEKRKNPTWTVPQSIINQLDNDGFPVPATARIQSGKHNPLGKYAMRLGKSSYLIHGNNIQHSIGQYVTQGCIRMYNQDIKELFSIVPINTPVTIINETIQIGQYNNDIFLAINNNPYNNISYVNYKTVENEIKQKLQEKNQLVNNINWLVIERIIDQNNSVPIKINPKQF